jgi:hypothetical protein
VATKKETVKICDVCKKRVTDEGQTWVGGHPFVSWFAVENHGGLTDLASLKAQKEWDVCGVECLRKLATQLK